MRSARSTPMSCFRGAHKGGAAISAPLTMQYSCRGASCVKIGVTARNESGDHSDGISICGMQDEEVMMKAR